jgi:hypothetical protein
MIGCVTDYAESDRTRHTWSVSERTVRHAPLFHGRQTWPGEINEGADLYWAQVQVYMAYPGPVTQRVNGRTAETSFTPPA